MAGPSFAFELLRFTGGLVEQSYSFCATCLYSVLHIYDQCGYIILRQAQGITCMVVKVLKEIAIKAIEPMLGCNPQKAKSVLLTAIGIIVQ
jgi:hypothetical protein